MKIKLVEAFAGIGCQRKALCELGVNIIDTEVIEFDEKVIEAYNSLHNTNFKARDIKNISGKNIFANSLSDVDILFTYSFPCQDLSTAGFHGGMKKGSSTRSGLLWEVERILNEMECLPKYLLMENVPMVHSKSNIDDFKLWISTLEKMGYKNYYKDLNAVDFLIPQSRNRTFMISILSEDEVDFQFPNSIELNCCLDDFLNEKVDSNYYSPHTNLNIEIPKRKNIKEKKPILYGGYGEKKSNKGSQYYFQDRVYDASAVSVALTTGFNPRYKVCKKPNYIQSSDSLNIRKLTPVESLRLMGFDNYSISRISKVSSNSSIYKFAGNGIVITVLMAIFGELFNIEYVDAIKKLQLDLISGVNN